MKTKSIPISVQRSSLLAIFFLFLLVLSLSSADGTKYTEDQIDNLVSCIKADNKGVRKCAIFLAGKYKIERAADSIDEVLKHEDEYDVILLAAIALFQIDEQRAAFSVLNLAVNTVDRKLSDLLVHVSASMSMKQKHVH